MCGLIDLNTVSNEDDGETTTTASSRDDSDLTEASPPPPPVAEAPHLVSMELWHACAGPLISLPKKGCAVVYLPQGHLEHLSDYPAVAYNLPPHVFCRVVDVKLHAEVETDEVYAQVSLVPDNQIEQIWKNGEVEADNKEDDSEGDVKSSTRHMFCKTLTASDTSTHGGFSVPRRAAEDCFPPLDYKQQRPSQEVVARDLHGMAWKFRHIYRGQPRRHLLTTGWSAFVNNKKLVSGDAVLFLKSGDGELRLGIRRSAQAKFGSPSTPSGPFSQQLNVSGILDVVNAISTRGIFSVCYNPRDSLSKFVVPYNKFCGSLSHSFTPGLRFKLHFETEDTAERRYTGLVIGTGDVDPVRWPGSKWRSLLVRWDDLDDTRHNRVSPWEIEPAGTVPGSINMVVPAAAKRPRIGLPTLGEDFAVCGDGRAVLDIGNPCRFPVLQGQEIFAANNIPGYDNSEISTRSRINIRALLSEPAHESFGGFAEHSRFNKVFQGQETYPRWSTPPPITNHHHNHSQTPHPSTPFLHQVSSSPPSVLMFQNQSAFSDLLGPQSSCTVFGFPILSEARNAHPMTSKESGPSSRGETATTSQVISKVMGSSFPRVSDPCASREVLLDIAL
ncbi:hypothetical protein DM860_001972 [Cuscuta australis]|uniref:Auxin response factor n=1 Tax=Cuscuta australis TaxID=267555 RepID=A0A328DZQ6_9ASTE|nr:hypothetical protein DM860_001972 [Cuscuta australis]